MKCLLYVLFYFVSIVVFSVITLHNVFFFFSVLIRSRVTSHSCTDPSLKCYIFFRLVISDPRRLTFFPHILSIRRSWWWNRVGYGRPVGLVGDVDAIFLPSAT